MSAEQKKIDIASVLAPAFHSVHCAIWDETHSEFWLKGGRGSTKSSFTAIQIILGIMRDPKANAMCLRKVGDTIRTSLFTTFLWAISQLQVEHLFSAIIAPATLTYVPTGQKIYMRGLDDPMKLKSVKAQNGYFKFLWFEEANEFHGMDEIRSVEQSVLRGGEKFIEFVTYNPPNDPAAWVNKESTIEHPKRFVHSSTYLDVPRIWLGNHFFELAERLKQNDPLKYQHEYMGDAVGRADQIIFHGKWEYKEFEAPENTRFYHGADWGFANDPTVLIRCYITDSDEGEYLWIDREVYGYNVEIDETPALFNKIETARNWPIKADCARPETISYMRRQGFNIDAAEKWPNSVEDGVSHLKGFRKIYVHPSCPKIAEEFMKYSYKVDKQTGDILPIVVDSWNHGIDSIRYGLDKVIKSRGKLRMWERLAE
jgi:PBSX family phage terminase large subunit